MPSGFEHCTDGRRCLGALDPHGNNSRCLAVHAETNALLQCRSLDDARVLYCSATPCYMCAKALLNTPITKIVAEEIYSGVEHWDAAFVLEQVESGRWEVLVRDTTTNELRPWPESF